MICKLETESIKKKIEENIQILSNSFVVKILWQIKLPCEKNSCLEVFKFSLQIGFLIPNQFTSEAKIRSFTFKISGQGVTDAPDQTKHVTLLTYWLLGLYKIGKKVLIKSESRGAIDQKVARSGTFPGNTSLKIRSTCAALTLVIIENHRQKCFFPSKINKSTAFDACIIRGSKLPFF